MYANADGASRGNPGPAAYGAVVYDAEDTEVRALGVAIGHTTNNVAEYRGAIVAVETALELGATELELRLDSERIVRQIEGRYRVKNATLKPLFAQLTALLDRLESVQVRHIPRKQNSRADELANGALGAKPTTRPRPGSAPSQVHGPIWKSSSPVPHHAIAYVGTRSRGNPGPAAFGAVLYAEDKVELRTLGQRAGRTTNSVAGYLGAIGAAKAAHQLEMVQFTLCMDLEIVGDQLNGQLRVKNEKLLPLYDELTRLIRRFKEFTAHRIPRSQNDRAHELADAALRGNVDDVL